MAEWGAAGLRKPAASSGDSGWLDVGPLRRTVRGAVWLVLTGVLPLTGLPVHWLLPVLAILLMVIGLDFGPPFGPIVAVVVVLVALFEQKPSAPSQAVALVLIPLAAVAMGSAIGFRFRRVRSSAQRAALRARLLAQALLRLPELESADSIYRELPMLLQEILGFTHADVLVPSPDGQRLLVQCTLGWTPPPGVTLPLKSITGRALSTRSIQHVPDTGADPDFVQGVGIAATHSEVALPIVAGDRVAAVLNIERASPGAFLPDELETLAALARAVGDAVWRLGRLTASQETSRLQNFLLDFSRQITQPGTPQSVGQRALQLLLPFTSADSGSIWLPGGTSPHLLAHRSVRGFSPPQLPSPFQISFRSHMPRQPLWVASALTSPYAPARQLESGLQSFVILPLLEPDGRPEAVLELLFYNTPTSFTESTRHALQRAADRLHLALQGILATSRLTELLAALHALGTIGDIHELSRQAIEAALRLIPGADAATLWLASGSYLELEAAAGYDDAGPARYWEPQSIEDAVGHYGDDASSFLQGLPRISGRGDNLGLHAQGETEAPSCICVPLVLHGELIGLLSVDNLTQAEAFSQEALSLSGMFGLQLAVLLAQGRHLSALRVAARTDALTGLGNRRDFDERMSTAWAEAKRYQQPLSLVIMDLQGFKAINDQYGHLSGDEALIAVAGALNAVRRDGDTVFRWGGDEFCILLTHADLSQSLQAAGRYLDAVRKAPVLLRQSREVYVGARVGVASAPEDGDSIEGLVRAADERVIMAKRLGRSLSPDASRGM